MAKCKCCRCGYKWDSEVAEPKKCAKCRSYLWNEPRKYRLKAKPRLLPTAERVPRSIYNNSCYGITLGELLDVLEEFEDEIPVYLREIRALKRITKNAFSNRVKKYKS